MEHGSTGVTPYKVFFSRCQDAILPLDLLTSPSPSLGRYCCEMDYVMQRKLACQEICEVVRLNTQKQIKMYVNQAERAGLKIRKYRVGDRVWRLNTPNLKDKLNPHVWLGPYTVEEVNEECYVVRLRVPAAGKKSGMVLKWIHMSNVKPVRYSRDGHLMHVRSPFEDWTGEGTNPRGFKS